MPKRSKYNPNIHHRRSIRLKGYDYSRAGAYFITICCEGRVCRFGHVITNEMVLNEYGWIAYHEWIKLSDRFPNFELDVFQIMPNHMHGIIMAGTTLAVDPNKDDIAPNNVRATLAVAPNHDDIAQNNVRATLAVAPNHDDIAPNNVRTTLAVAPNENDMVARSGAGASPAPTVGDIVGAYKSLVANECLKIYKSKNETMGKFWQRNYYERIIRNERSYQNISNYIINNPVKWNDDKFFTTT